MTIQQTERAREILMDDVFVKHMVERLRKIIWSVTGCSDSLAELAAGEVADYIAAMPSIPQESDAEVFERILEKASGAGYSPEQALSEIEGIARAAMTSARDREQPK